MMGFSNPYFLIGVVAAAVPLLIFLFTRDTVRKVAFSTLRFFAGASHTLLRRKRWQEMLLLATRMLICSLLAVAFARPLLKSHEAGEDGATEAAHAVAVVIDVSASMGQPGAFEAARKIAGKTLDELPSGAAVSLVAFDRTPRVEIPWTFDLAAVRARIDALMPGAGGTDIAAAIRKADESLQQIASGDKRIVVVSDLQRTGWEGFVGSFRLHHGVKLDIQPVKAEKGVAAALVAADCPQSVINDAAQHAITVRIANFSAEPISALPVRLDLGDAVHETQNVNLAPGDNVTVRFRSKFDHEGDNRGTVRLGDVSNGDKDATTLGSAWFFNARVIPKIEVRVLIASGGDKDQRAGESFLRTALAPSAESPFAVQCLPADPLSGYPAATAADLAPAAVVMLADVDSVSTPVRSALGEVLKRGGGLLFLPGASVRPEQFNLSFGELAPCKLRRVVAAGEVRRGSAKAVLTKISYEHPVFEVFERPHFGDFSAVRFDRYWEVADSQLAKVPARFDDGRPFLVEQPIGGGNSALLTSAVDGRWNNLPYRAIFLPLMHQIAAYLARRTERPSGYLVGDILPMPPEHSLRDPSGQVHSGGSFRADRNGFYELLDAAGKVDFTCAVNSDLAESNMAAVDPAEIKAALEPAGGSEEAALMGEAMRAGGSGQDIWPYLVAALMLLTVSELFLSNRVVRH